MRLIRKIVAGWDWSAYKPPVVVSVDGGFHVLDGQHTAIAAASHGGIQQIPVLVVQAVSEMDRARAFVAHNRDRIAMTSQALHHAMVAAGDEDAVTIEQVCSRAGVRVLRSPPWNGAYAAGDTLAIGAIGLLCRKRHAMGARKVLDVLAAARLAPITADHIKAVESLIFDQDNDGINLDKIAAQLLSAPVEIMREAEQLAAAKSWQRWRALAIVLSRNNRKRVAA